MSDRPRDYLSDSVKKKAVGTDVRFLDNKKKYSSKQYVGIYKGYDMLENLFTVRSYIQKHYDISWSTLELYLKLMGMRIFTREEYSQVPRDFQFQKFKSLRDSGCIIVVSDHNKVEERLYTLSTKSKNIVTNFYAYLSGEKKIPEDSVNNPMFNKNKQVPFDKKKAELIKKMNQLPIPAHKKKLFL